MDDRKNIWKTVTFLIGLPLLLIVILVALLVESSVAAVAPVEEKLQESENPEYAFFAEVPNSSSDDEDESAHIYRVEGKRVEEVSKHIQSLQKPKEQALPLNDRHLLAYPEALVTVYQDLDESSDVLVEVAPEEFVKEQYHPQLFTEETDLFDDDPFGMPKFHAYRSYYTGFINWDRQYTLLKRTAPQPLPFEMGRRVPAALGAGGSVQGNKQRGNRHGHLQPVSAVALHLVDTGVYIIFRARYLFRLFFVFQGDPLR